MSKDTETYDKCIEELTHKLLEYIGIKMVAESFENSQFAINYDDFVKIKDDVIGSYGDILR